MSYCTECGQEMKGAAKFCGNCGHQVGGSRKSAAAETSTSEESYGPGADRVISFIGGRVFKIICTILACIGVVYGIATGGLKSSSIPSVSETVRPPIYSGSRKYPTVRPRQDVRETSAYKRRQAAGLAP